MSRLFNHLLSVDFPTNKDFGTSASRYYWKSTKGFYGNPYVRLFHGVSVVINPGSRPEFIPNGYQRTLGNPLHDSTIPKHFQPVGYWSPEMEKQSYSWPDETTGLGRGFLEDAFVSYFDVSPEMMEVQRQALVRNMVPTGRVLNPFNHDIKAEQSWEHLKVLGVPQWMLQADSTFGGNIVKPINKDDE